MKIAILFFAFQTIFSVCSLKTFKKASSEWSIFTKSNDVTVLGIFPELKSKHARHYKAAAKMWAKSGVEFAITSDNDKSFRKKFGDEKAQISPSIWAQVNFREDGSLRRGRKRRVGFFFEKKDLSYEQSVHEIQKFFYTTLLRPINFFPAETDAGQRVQMAIQSRMPKLFVTHNTKLGEDEMNILADINRRFLGKMHVIAVDIDDVTGASKMLLKSLNVDANGKTRGVFLYDTFSREVSEYPQALQKIVTDIDSFIQDKLSKYDDEDYRYEVRKKKKKRKKGKKKKRKKKNSDEL